MREAYLCPFRYYLHLCDQFLNLKIMAANQSLPTSTLVAELVKLELKNKEQA